tara:strand:- start:182635 stop:183174 length:540 start_codon:yes stop_codon:yes gene_type:complete
MAINSKKTITDFSSQIAITNTVKVDLPADILEVKDLELITAIYGIIQKYKTDDWIEQMSVTEMTADLMTLQAHQVSVMYRFGTLTSYADTVEDRVKLARAKVRMQIKALRQSFESNGDAVSITADDCKDLSYTKTEKIWEDLQKIRTTADFLKSMYFSVKDHVSMLNSTIHRVARFEIQ